MQIIGQYFVCRAGMSEEVLGDSSFLWDNIIYDLCFMYIYFQDSAI